MRRGWRWGLISAGGLMAAVVASVGLVAGALNTEQGSRWVLGQVPGLAIEGFEGRLGSQWRAGRLVWSDGAGMRVSVEAPQLAWRPGCLLRRTLCIDHLQATQVSIEPAPAGEPQAPAEPLQLPTLRLPVGLELGEVAVNEVRYAGQPLLNDVQLKAGWNASGVQVGTLNLGYGQMHLTLHGNVRPEGDWPLDAQLALVLPTVDGRAWEMAGTLKGNVAGTLNLAAKSSGYLDGTLTATLKPLAEHFPAMLDLQAATFTPQQSLPSTLKLNGLNVHAQGDLSKGYDIQGNATLPGDQGPVALLLRGQAGAEGASIGELSLAASPRQRAVIQGSLSWAEGLAAEANLNWQDFPWTSLYPQRTPPPVQARQVNALVRYRNGNYMGNLDGQFSGPAGPFSLLTPFSGDATQLALPQLLLKAGAGELAGQIKLDFAQGLGWIADLTLANLNPAYWVASLPGKLGGQVASQGRWQDGALSMNAQLGVTGQLRNQAARLQGTVEGRGNRWTLAGLELALGANRVTGNGSSQSRVDGTLIVDAPRLDQLWPGLAGALKGRVSLGGSLDNPEGQLQLDGQRLAWQGNRMARLGVTAALNARQQATLALKGTGLGAGDTELGTLVVDGSGSLVRHSVRLELGGPLVAASLSANGSWEAGAWKGRLASGKVASHGQTWAQEGSATLQRLADGTIDLGAHCWRSGEASLCADNQRLAPEPRLRIRLRDFPLAKLRPWLPADLGWEGNANADVELDLAGTGPKGVVAFDASNGTLKINQGSQHLDVPYGTLRLASQIAPRGVDTLLDFEGGRLGQLHVQAKVDPISEAKPLSGSFRLEGLDLAVLGPLVEQAERVAGTLDGNGQLSGTLFKPQVAGAFSLKGGALSAPGLPMTVEHLELQAHTSGDHLQLQGSWRSGTQGQGQVDGSVDWAGPLRMDMAVRGSRLPIVVPPYAQVEAGADLHLKLANDTLALSGNVTVPRGAVTVRQLPPSTVKVSSDAVVVGREAKASPQLGIAMDVNVDVGQDRLTFSGFGLQSNLVGHVHIADNLDTRGSLELRDGRYRAYGQRLTLRRARLFFTGPIDQPYLDVEAIRQTDDVIAGIRLSGSAQQPTSEVFAEPAMSQEEALSWLVLGRPLTSNSEDNNLLAQAALGLGLMGSASTTGKLAKDLGIQDFQLDTEGSGNSTSVVASGNLTERLTLRYGVGVFEPASTVALRYALTRQLYLEAASGVASSLDLFYKKDF